MQPGPRGGDPSIGDSQRHRCVDPVGETALPPFPSWLTSVFSLFLHTVADPMSQHKRPGRKKAMPAKADQPALRPAHECAPTLSILNPHAAGIDVHSDMHM